MPVFGEYETFGEPISLTEERGHTSTVWQARLAGSKDGRAFAIKCYLARPRKPRPGESEETLDKDRGLEFLEAIKQLKKAQTDGARCLCPIHAFGIAPEGAWYVTDFYPGKTLKELIVRRGRVDSAALRHVVRSVVTGCLALKGSRGYSHGNLKAANVFLVGGPKALSKRPIELGDPYPASASQLSGLDEEDRRAVSDLLNQTVEAQDLRALGELLLQLVRGRVIANAFDFDYPIARSPAWDHLGKEGETWRELTNQLLSPQLSLETINLELLEKRFPPGFDAGKLRKLAMAAGGVIVVGGALYLALWIRHKGAGEKFQQHLLAAQQALSLTNLSEGRREIEQALRIRPDHSAAQSLKNNIEAQIDTAFNRSYLAAQRGFPTNESIVSQEIERALKLKPDDKAAKDLQESFATYQSAQGALDKGDFETAEKQSSAVLTAWPNDSTTLAMLKKARDGKTEKANFEAALGAARDALAKENFDEAERQANNILKTRPRDAAAQALLTEINKARTKKGENEYELAMLASREALAKEDFDKADAGANAALKARPKDSKAQAMLTRISEVKANKERYNQAMKAGQNALGKDDDEAEQHANAALKLRPRDTEALAFLDKVREDRAQRGNYDAALKAAKDALDKQSFDDAERQANNALKVRPRDSAATTVLTRAREGKANKAAYDAAMKEAQAALTKANYGEAEKQANDALKLRAGDAAAQGLAEQARNLRASQGRFEALLNAAREALSKSDFGEAELQASNALAFRRDDTVAQAILKEARDSRTTQEGFTSALKAGQAALGRENYDEAEFQAGSALKLRPGDASAEALRTAAQVGRTNKVSFETAQKAAQEAAAKGNYDEAERQAMTGLKIRTNDAPLLALLTKAREDRASKTKYEEAMKAAQGAMANENYVEAEKQADAALKARPGDATAQSVGKTASASRLRKENLESALKSAQADLEKGDQESAFSWATNAMAASGTDSKAALALLQTITTNAFNDAIKIKDGDAAARWLVRSTNAQVAAPVMAVFAKAIVGLPVWPAQLPELQGIAFVKVGKSPTAGKIFYAAKYEITGGQFNQIVNGAPAAPQETRPATGDPQAAAGFCDKLNKQLPLECARLGLKGGTIRLPSQDEYLAMALVTPDMMEKGKPFQVSTNAFEQIKRRGEVVGLGQGVDPKPAVPGQCTNSLGLVNIIGNIPEWSQDGKILGLSYYGTGKGRAGAFVNDPPQITGTVVGFRPILIPE
jgi:hypothetical protein